MTDSSGASRKVIQSADVSVCSLNSRACVWAHSVCGLI